MPPPRMLQPYCCSPGCRPRSEQEAAIWMPSSPAAGSLSSCPSWAGVGLGWQPAPKVNGEGGSGPVSKHKQFPSLLFLVQKLFWRGKKGTNFSASSLLLRNGGRQERNKRTYFVFFTHRGLSKSFSLWRETGRPLAEMLNLDLLCHFEIQTDLEEFMLKWTVAHIREYPLLDKIAILAVKHDFQSCWFICR